MTGQRNPALLYVGLLVFSWLAVLGVLNLVGVLVAL